MSASTEEGTEPNLTPILDMVFQLITFFMLVINFKGAALDLSLKLPVLGSARPLGSTAEGILVLNINSNGKLNVYGVERDVRSYIAEEARVEIIRRTTRDKPLEIGDELPTTIVIRADKGIPFKQLNQVVGICQEFGFRRFALRAMNRDDDAGGNAGL